MTLTETQVNLLLHADPWVYCGFDQEILGAAEFLDAEGLGVLGENSLGPVFSTNDAGRAALDAHLLAWTLDAPPQISA